MSIFIDKPLETLLPFVNLVIILTNVVILFLLLPTVVKLLKKEVDLFLSYILIVAFLGSFSGYLFVNNVFINSVPSNVVFLTFLSAVIAISHYSLVSLRRALDQDFEIKRSYKGILVVFLFLLVVQVFFNNTLISIGFLVFAFLFNLVFYRDIFPVFGRKRVLIFSLFLLLLVVSIFVDLVLLLNGALSSIFIFAISVVVSVILLYEIVSKYLSLKEKNISMVSYLEKLSGVSKDLSRILEEIGNTKIRLEKGVFSANHDLTKLVNKVVSYVSEISEFRGKIALLRGVMTKLIEEFSNLPDLESKLAGIKGEIIINLKNTQDKCEKCKSFLEESYSEFSQISNDLYAIIQVFKKISDYLVSRKEILQQINENVSKIQKDISLVEYVSVSGMMEFDKRGNTVMASVYQDIKSLANHIYEELSKVRLLIHQLVLVNEELEYLSKKILGELYSSISLIDSISNESDSFRKLLQRFSNIILSNIDEVNNVSDRVIKFLLLNMDRFMEFFNKIVEVVDTLDSLFDYFTKIAQFVNPLRNSVFLIKEAFSGIDRSLNEIKGNIEKLEKEIVY